MCCKHYLDLVEMAFKDNNERERILLNIIQLYSLDKETGGYITQGSDVLCNIRSNLDPI